MWMTMRGVERQTENRGWRERERVEAVMVRDLKKKEKKGVGLPASEN